MKSNLLKILILIPFITNCADEQASNISEDSTGELQISAKGTTTSLAPTNIQYMAGKALGILWDPNPSATFPTSTETDDILSTKLTATENQLILALMKSVSGTPTKQNCTPKPSLFPAYLNDQKQINKNAVMMNLTCAPGEMEIVTKFSKPTVEQAKRFCTLAITETIGKPLANHSEVLHGMCSSLIAHSQLTVFTPDSAKPDRGYIKWDVSYFSGITNFTLAEMSFHKKAKGMLAVKFEANDLAKAIKHSFFETAVDTAMNRFLTTNPIQATMYLISQVLTGARAAYGSDTGTTGTIHAIFSKKAGKTNTTQFWATIDPTKFLLIDYVEKADDTQNAQISAKTFKAFFIPYAGTTDKNLIKFAPPKGTLFYGKLQDVFTGQQFAKVIADRIVVYRPMSALTLNKTYSASATEFREVQADMYLDFSKNTLELKNTSFGYFSPSANTFEAYTIKDDHYDNTDRIRDGIPRARKHLPFNYLNQSTEDLDSETICEDANLKSKGDEYRYKYDSYGSSLAIARYATMVVPGKINLKGDFSEYFTQGSQNIYLSITGSNGSALLAHMSYQITRALDLVTFETTENTPVDLKVILDPRGAKIEYAGGELYQTMAKVILPPTGSDAKCFQPSFENYYKLYFETLRKNTLLNPNYVIQEASESNTRFSNNNNIVVKVQGPTATNLTDGVANLNVATVRMSKKGRIGSNSAIISAEASPDFIFIYKNPSAF